MTKARRSTGSPVTWRERRTYFNASAREASQAADVAAVDRGEAIRVILGSFRGGYGKYRRLRAGLLYLEPQRPILRFLWWRVPVMEQILSARVRPFKGYWEKVQRGGRREFELEERVIIECLTTGGTLEFGVGTTDVDLVLHYLNKLAAAAVPPAPA